jgi:hypothetical protein
LARLAQALLLNVVNDVGECLPVACEDHHFTAANNVVHVHDGHSGQECLDMVGTIFWWDTPAHKGVAGTGEGLSHHRTGG